eukprot:5855167-Pyramimonas_sp.AAC.1
MARRQGAWACAGRKGTLHEARAEPHLPTALCDDSAEFSAQRAVAPLGSMSPLRLNLPHGLSQAAVQGKGQLRPLARGP